MSSSTSADGNDLCTIVRAIIEGRPYKFPQSTAEKTKLIEALTARATTAVLDHQHKVIDRIKKVIATETDIPEDVFLKTIRDAAAKEAAEIIQNEADEELGIDEASVEADVNLDVPKK